jgi:hypothetical protein
MVPAPEYPKSHVMTIAALNALPVIIGLAIVAAPFVRGVLPGSFETTVSAGLGALIFALALFRAALGYVAIWLDVLLIALGVLIFTKPTYMHMHWDAKYTTAHMVGGGIIIAVAVISALITIPVAKRHKHA